MTMTTEQAIREATASTWERALQLWPRLPVWLPQQRFDLRGATAGTVASSGVKAGRARYVPGTVTVHHIRWNVGIASDNLDAYIARTVPHEIAHVVSLLLHAEGGHGPTWKRIVTTLGGSATRCHSYDVANHVRRRNGTRMYTCGCDGKEHAIGVTRQKRMARGTIYSCSLCGSKLQPK